MMAVSALAGCGDDNKDISTSSTEESSAAGESSAEESGDDTATAGTWQKFDDVQLKYLSCWNGGMKTASDQYNNEIATAIRDKIGVTIEFEGIMMSETEKLNLMFASGDMPDIVNAPYWGGDTGETAVIKKAEREGRLLPLEEELPKYENLKSVYDIGRVSQAYLDQDIDIFDGHRYVIPMTLGVPGDPNSYTNWCYGVFVRGDVPEALGIDPTTVTTSDALYDFMVKARDYGFKDINGNDCLVATTFHEGWDYSGYGMNFAEKKVTSYTLLDDGTYTYDALTDAWVERNIFYWRMVNENLLDKECFKCNDTQANEKVGNGTALFASAQYSVIINATKLTGMYDANPEMRYVPVGPLTYEDGSPLVQLETSGATGSGVIFFPTTCQNLDAALTWLDYVNSEEGMRLCSYGIEGVTYHFNENNQPRLNDDILERKIAGDTSVDDELREMGIGYMAQVTGDHRYEWWGEKAPGDEANKDPDLAAYELVRPVEIVEGYPLSALVNGYENYETVSQFAFQGTTMNDYCQRAFFAETEEEARQILKDYQDYLTTQENGMFLDFLEYVNEVAKTRDDVII